MLRIKFLGVGDGDCIFIEFPDARVAVVDSHRRPDSGTFPAQELVSGRKLAFCCMTHPHADHYKGLRELLSVADVGDRGAEPVFYHTLSELDRVSEDLFSIVTSDDKDLAVFQRKKDNTTYLKELFVWIERTFGSGFCQPIKQITHKYCGGVKVCLVPPEHYAWTKYADDLKQRRKTKRDPAYNGANEISLAISLSYGGTRVWLVGDLGSGQQLTLADRAVKATPDAADGAYRARVLKVSHHGAKNAWDRQIPNTLLVCDRSDLVIISADGSTHPDKTVFEEWINTGKRVHGTWQPAVQGDDRLSQSSTWDAQALDSVAPRVRNSKKACDIEVLIDSTGKVEYTNTCAVSGVIISRG